MPMARVTHMSNIVLASLLILDTKPQPTKAMSTQKIELADLAKQKGIILEKLHIERVVVLSGKAEITESSLLESPNIGTMMIILEH